MRWVRCILHTISALSEGIEYNPFLKILKHNQNPNPKIFKFILEKLPSKISCQKQCITVKLHIEKIMQKLKAVQLDF